MQGGAAILVLAIHQEWEPVWCSCGYQVVKLLDVAFQGCINPLLVSCWPIAHGYSAERRLARALALGILGSTLAQLMLVESSLAG